MGKFKQKNDITLGKVISAIIIGVLLSALVVFTIYYDPNKQFSNSFFNDVSNAIKWKQ